MITRKLSVDRCKRGPIVLLGDFVVGSVLFVFSFFTVCVRACGCVTPRGSFRSGRDFFFLFRVIVVGVFCDECGLIVCECEAFVRACVLQKDRGPTYLDRVIVAEKVTSKPNKHTHREIKVVNRFGFRLRWCVHVSSVNHLRRLQ